MSNSGYAGKLPLPRRYEYMVCTSHCMDFTEDCLSLQKEGWTILENTFFIMDFNVKFIVRRMLKL